MMLPFAGPLRAYTGKAMNVGWEIVGDGGTGKSVLLDLMGSTCGNPLAGEQGYFGLSFATTDAGIEWEYQNYSDLIMLIDEGNLYEMDATSGRRGKAFSKLIMGMGKGQEKHRYRTTSRTFRFVFATSANETLIDIVRGSSAKAVTDAVADRLMTIPLTGREFGIFDFLPEAYEDNAGDFFADLMSGAIQHHGLAMPHYLQELVNLVAEDRYVFVSKVARYVADFRREACIDANAGSLRRVAEAFGLVYAAGRLACHVGSLPTNYEPLSATLACYRLYRSAMQSEQSAAQILIGLANDKEVFDLDRNPPPEMSKHDFDNTKAFRKTNRQGRLEIQIPVASIRRLVPDWNRVKRDDFEVARLLVREGERNTVKRRIRANSASEDRVVCLVVDPIKAGEPAAGGMLESDSELAIEKPSICRKPEAMVEAEGSNKKSRPKRRKSRLRRRRGSKI